MSTSAVIRLPFPPSVWDLYEKYRNKHTKVYPKTKQYQKWEADAWGMWLEQRLACPKLIGRQVHITVALGMPSKHERDASNHLKAPEDFLKSCGVISDDNWKFVLSSKAKWDFDAEPGAVVTVEAVE